MLYDEMCNAGEVKPVLTQVFNTVDIHGRRSNDLINSRQPSERLAHALSWGGGLTFKSSAQTTSIDLIVDSVFHSTASRYSYHVYKEGGVPPDYAIVNEIGPKREP